MKFHSLVGIAFAAGIAAASPAQAGGVAACFGSVEGRDGLTDFSAYTLARSETTGVSRSALQDEAERQFRASNPSNQRVRCHGTTDGGHFVIVRAAQALNGRTIQLLGVGFGATRSAALADSERRLSEYPDYNMFVGRGGRLEVLEEGAVEG
ncbi:MAG: hypothetical protein H7X93_09730 [Sphingomonadaceae bacterium]|nr:hypothetical protein [Sphingomonadaceae bacterium]